MGRLLPGERRSPPRSRRAGPLRVGYVGPAFCNHSSGHFIESVLAHHDPACVEVSCYSSVARSDELTERCRKLAARWIDTAGMTHDQVADRIRADEIDLAVDLAGHTLTSSLDALRSRPAPVQVTYLGYPNTTGVPWVDYRLVDSLTDPGGAGALATETLVRLDPCFLCYTPPPHAPEPSVRADGGPVVFGSFNTNAKVSGATLDLWARLLLSVPGSTLVLKNLDLGDATIGRARRRDFESRGVSPDRLDLRAETPTKCEHMGLYNGIDIALDPFPYNGTTTTVEALWMGVPVVTLTGRGHAARVGTSLLSCVGLPDLIGQTPDHYLSIAAGLAADMARRTVLRRGLRERVRGSPLCDGRGFVRRLEAEFREMWREHEGR